ncbi:TIGR04282 family arsenosugar biosynthesis glycosyltransferase [Pleurocapsa sp. FMAR1]|uniref:TIGR04282 family arsenosugar biosynthesis glycosyltransferase n=1 Tax=Pleurocapsa sp. FMAR1 TaxID=3040204 RepID=UPI0029C74F95|nr:TIGR04282 family arsenosugar biosynthesis glycosyltransferase [Pleurocapsa sp. FMAR1]
MRETLIIFSRYPEAGKTKTRMIPALDAKGAAELQRQMSEHTLNTARNLKSYRDITIELHFAGGNKQLMAEWLGKDLEYIPQVIGDLGYKMRSAFERAFSLGSKRVVTIGTDCPDIDRAILEAAFNSLSDRDLVIGSATDGGYYLIGLNCTIPELFADINWGTDRVLNQTKAIATQLDLNIHYLKTLSDVDRPEDLAIWQKYI